MAGEHKPKKQNQHMSAKAEKPEEKKKKTQQLIAAILGRDPNAEPPKCRVAGVYTGNGKGEYRWVPMNLF